MSLGRNILKILSSKVAVQLITFATFPILARIFTPEVFGIRQVFSSIFAILAVICCLRYELSIPLGRDKKEAASSFLLSVFLTVLLGGIREAFRSDSVGGARFCIGSEAGVFSLGIGFRCDGDGFVRWCVRSDSGGSDIVYGLFGSRANQRYQKQ